MNSRDMRQAAPYPLALAGLVDEIDYMPGWMFALMDSERPGGSGLTLHIALDVPDSRDRGKMMTIHHPMEVPAAIYGARAWKRWLLDQIMLVSLHEAMERLRFGDVLAFPPDHCPGMLYRVTDGPS